MALSFILLIGIFSGRRISRSWCWAQKLNQGELTFLKSKGDDVDKEKTKKATRKKSLISKEELEFREGTLRILRECLDLREAMLEVRERFIDEGELLLDKSFKEFERKTGQAVEGSQTLDKKKEVAPLHPQLSATHKAIEEASQKRATHAKDRKASISGRQKSGYQYVLLEGGRELALPLHLKPNEYTKIKEIYSAALRASDAGWCNFWTMVTSNPGVPEQVPQNTGDEFLDRIEKMATSGEDMLFLFAIAKQVQELEADTCQL